MSKAIRFLIFFLMIIYILFTFSNVVFATESGTMDPSQFEDKENPIDEATDSISKNIIGVLRIVGATVAIVMLLVIAMRYMTSAPGDRADIKKHAIAYVIGAVILFGVPAILGVLVEVAEAINAK